jgi:hypothetical protein
LDVGRFDSELTMRFWHPQKHALLGYGVGDVVARIRIGFEVTNNIDWIYLRDESTRTGLAVSAVQRTQKINDCAASRRTYLSPIKRVSWLAPREISCPEPEGGELVSVSTSRTGLGVLCLSTFPRSLPYPGAKWTRNRMDIEQIVK